MDTILRTAHICFLSTKLLYSTVNILIIIFIQLLKTLVRAHTTSYRTQIAKLRLAAQFQQLSDEMTRLRLLPPNDPQVEQRISNTLFRMDLMQEMSATCTDADEEIKLVVSTAFIFVGVIVRSLHTHWTVFYSLLKSNPSGSIWSRRRL